MEESLITKHAVRKMYHMIDNNNNRVSYSAENNGELLYAPVLKLLHCKIIHRPTHMSGPPTRWKCLISDGTYFMTAVANDSIKYMFDSRAVRSGTIFLANRFRIWVTRRDMKVISLYDITPLTHGTTDINIDDYKDVNIIKMSDEVLHEI